MYRKRKCNTVFVSSFQMGDKTLDPLTITHGWIGLAYKNITQFYHITLREPMSRADYIARIGIIGVELLWARNATCLTLCSLLSNAVLDCIDIVLNAKLEPMVEYTLGMLLRQPYFRRRYLFGGTRADSWCVWNNCCAISDKSSDCVPSIYNPRSVHLQIIQETQSKFPDAVALFMISVNTVDKGQVAAADIAQRIQWINQMGFDCLVNSRGRYIEAIVFLRICVPRPN